MHDLIFILQWWFMIFILGIIFFPLTSIVFEGFFDKGYIFSKVLAIGIISYVMFLLNILKIIPFNDLGIFLVLGTFSLVNFALIKRSRNNKDKIRWKIIIFEEILFLMGILFWSYIRGHEPAINGLEKFMDFGFINSILRSTYMPPVDMWFTPLSINYYYFGHFTTAVLTKLSLLPSYITFNLMLATLFAFTFTLAFSLGINLFPSNIFTRRNFITGILTGTLLSFGGNLHAIYTLFKPYNVDNPLPFWNLVFNPGAFPNNYWYPNATRFIPFTIHEFPIYSFVVSDLHGHVLDIMYVLLSIALIYSLFIRKELNKTILILISLFLAIMYMTNAWDGAIYMILILIILVIRQIITERLKKLDINFFIKLIKPILGVLVLFLIFSLPFNYYFKPFAQGIGILCAPDFLTKIGRVGPILFETDHCQRSPWWQLLTLYGFFYFFVISFLVFIYKTRKKTKLLKQDIFILIITAVASLLIIIPEFIYLKDIYPAHYRANTMFKLVYQSFMMLTIVASYVIVRIISQTKSLVFYLITLILIAPVLVYPYFAIKSYYGDLKNYSGLDGTKYLINRYPQDYKAINWLNKNVKGSPVIVEAQGDSYTDYARISSNTGLPTILGWTVHEWLWRGSYEVTAPRIAEVKDIYENPDIDLTIKIIKKYNAKYIHLGDLERQKYPNLLETKFEKIGKVVFSEGKTKIYKLN